MKALLQVVKHASVTIDGKQVACIGHGLLIFLGVSATDTKEIADKMLDKILKLRTFDDAEGKTNLSVRDVEGELLIVSQFTLYADCKKGNRPSFTNAAPPAFANEMYEYFLNRATQEFGRVGHGEFGADMKVELLNNGPFTIMLDSDEIIKKT